VSVIDDLTTELSRLPGIGRKTAQRLTYHLLRQPAAQSRRLAEALVALTERVQPCTRCHNLTETPLCALCTDPRRDGTLVCVVEEASDIASIDLAIGSLLARVAAEGIGEVILATNPSLEGEATALYVQRQLAAQPVRVTRIARGLPVGGDLEYADGVTIAQAIAARRDM